ncbi:helix-turn-helix transcriptional regulator [Roseateles sp. DC23W]|uniref:Helix-turn-helix transcriptional regulator n=1 Tax=Pelomonas dachongensis TaxID=3299029 RepID=A0ABW7EUZ9_9BURK
MSPLNISVPTAQAHVAPFKPLTKEDVASLLDVTSRCIEQWVEQGLLPRWRKLGNRCFWHPDVFFSWLDTYLKSEASLPDKDANGSSLPERAKRGRIAESPVGAANARRMARILEMAGGEEGPEVGGSTIDGSALP